MIQIASQPNMGGTDVGGGGALLKQWMAQIIGADYAGAWGLEPPLETATGGLSPL